MRGRALSAPNPSVGAIIVKDGRVIGRGWTQPGGRPHGEAQALRQASDLAAGATLYTTLEPCAHPSDRGPTCSHIIAEAGITRVVYALEDPDSRTAGAGAQILRDAGVAADHVANDAAAESLAGYLMQRLSGRPLVTLKLAISLDGFIAHSSGESQWITGEISRAHVHSQRAKSDAILVGGSTWRADQPQLNVRLPGLDGHHPQRIILTRGVPIDGVKIINRPEQISTLDDCQYLYIEGGAQTAASFLAADLVDRIDLYRAPILLGSGLPALGDYGLADLASSHGQWKMTRRQMLGSDTYEAYARMRAQRPSGE